MRRRLLVTAGIAAAYLAAAACAGEYTEEPAALPVEAGPQPIDSAPPVIHDANGAEGGEVAEDAAADVEDAGTLPPPADGSIDAEPRCGPLFQGAYFNRTPSGATGTVCGGGREGGVQEGTSLFLDQEVVGLDYGPGGTSASVGGSNVSSCLEAQFGRRVDEAVIRVRPIGNACGFECKPPGADAGDGCGTGRNASVFVNDSLDAGGYRFLRQLNLEAGFNNYTVRIDGGAELVMVCRGGFGSVRDDVQVSAFSGRTCD